MSSFLRAK